MAEDRTAAGQEALITAEASRCGEHVRGKEDVRAPRDHHPQFYWNKIGRYIGDALRYLEMTMEGMQWIATLYCHIFATEPNRRRMGPQPEPRR